jgi:rare lipoprotein A
MFHERRTSSGEKYDMLAMTAAHKTLPLPTYVEVTNLKNNRTIIVKVNDRGPFSSNRIIDLSYVAAKKLGMLGRGTADVRIRALNPYTYAAAPSRALGKSIRQNAPAIASSIKSHATNSARYVFLQAGAFKNKERAIKLQNRLANMITFPVRVSHPVVNSNLYRVQIGPIRDNTSAEQVSRDLKNIGIHANKVQGA